MSQTEGAMPPVHIRPVRRDDRAGWAKLWTAYLAYYETVLGDDIFEATFDRLTDPGHKTMFGFVAEVGGRLVGLVHVIVHEHGWKHAPVLYLQDLYADPAIRGQGIGRKLIEAIYAAEADYGAATTYWLTQEFNHKARHLYDRVAVLTPFIKYQRA